MHSLLFESKNTAHVGATEFKAIYWLPTKNRVDQHICVNIMKFFKGTAPAYADEIFQPVDQSRVTRRSKFKLNLPIRKSSAGQKCLSYMGPKIWNSLSSSPLQLMIYTSKYSWEICYHKGVSNENVGQFLLSRRQYTWHVADDRFKGREGIARGTSNRYFLISPDMKVTYDFSSFLCNESNKEMLST